LNKSIEHKLNALFEKYSGKSADTITTLPSSGSYRQYYRLAAKDIIVIGAYNPDEKENTAFLSFSKHFHQQGLPVPSIYAANEAEHIYLIEDLGDTTLFSFISENRSQHDFSDEIITYYKKVITALPKFQINAAKGLDFNVCYPRAQFDKQSMLWDLSYFKYYFLKLAKISFDEQKLEDDFQTFTDYLLQTDCNYFLYRDFQSRNIMVKNGEPFFIDYQGGRKGALQYDIASLLYDAKADIPNEIRISLLNYYLDCLTKYITVNKKEFISYYYGYVMIRIMQALGAYGFRGFYEKKEHFLQSIPYALDNLAWLLENTEIPVKIPTLMNILHKLSQSESLRLLGKKDTMLKVVVNSFSYKTGIPADLSGNGGGFVFDCRALHNPGKYEEYKKLTGKDKEVIEFLEKETEMYEFMNHVYGMVDRTIENYLKRNFFSLQVSFGCTGGQHRSVFCANLLADHLKKKFDIEITLQHQELEKNKSLLS
jgi:aminoglycoside/choline kinase family phosphotransferase